MTLTAPALASRSVATAAARLRTVLRADATVTGAIVGELALAWVAATAVVIALGLAEPAGVALLVAVALATAAFGVTELRLARQVRAQS